jgi:3',5'-cyclic-AMP phosphodiesterase
MTPGRCDGLLMARPFVLAQISDLHLKADGQLSYGVFDAATMLRACVTQLLSQKQRPDAVAITGDLTDLGLPAQYALLRELIAPLEMPVYLIPGNHDRRDAMRAAFPDHAYLRQSHDRICYAIDVHVLRIVALDTLVEGQSGGNLDEASLAWLDRTLAAAPGHATVVLMHHPPFATYIGHLDRFGLRSAAPLATVIERHPQVHAILCGHVHRPIQARFAGTVASTAPSVAHQIPVDLESEAPSRFAMEPPAYRLHAYSPESGLASHTAYVGTFPGPYSFGM